MNRNIRFRCRNLTESHHRPQTECSDEEPLHGQWNGDWPCSARYAVCVHNGEPCLPEREGQDCSKLAVFYAWVTVTGVSRCRGLSARNIRYLNIGASEYKIYTDQGIRVQETEVTRSIQPRCRDTQISKYRTINVTMCKYIGITNSQYIKTTMCICITISLQHYVNYWLYHYVIISIHHYNIRPWLCRV